MVIEVVQVSTKFDKIKRRGKLKIVRILGCQKDLRLGHGARARILKRLRRR